MHSPKKAAQQMERTQGKKAGTKTTDRGDNKTQTRHRQGKAEGTGMSEEQPKTQTTSKCQDTTTEKENAHTAQGNTSQETTAAPKKAAPHRQLRLQYL